MPPKKHLAVVPADPQPEPAMIAVRIQLTFTVDGQAVGAVVFPGQFPTPPEGQGAHLELKINARELVRQLETAIGPAVPVSPLWTPRGQTLVKKPQD